MNGKCHMALLPVNGSIVIIIIINIIDIIIGIIIIYIIIPP